MEGAKKVKYIHQKSLHELSHAVSRRLSFLADSQVSSHIGGRYSTITAIVFALNMTLGTGPLTLPFAFAQAGFVLGGGFLAICAVMGYITATYIIETLVLGNVALFEAAEENLLAGETIEEPEASGRTPTAKELSGEYIQKRPDKVFKIRERIELGEMGQRMLPRGLHSLLYTLLFMHTFGTLCVYSVTVITSVETLLPSAWRSHELVCVCFGAAVFPLCFADMQKLRSLQSWIMAMRVVAILALLGGAVYTVMSRRQELAVCPGAKSAQWTWHDIPMANTDGLPDLFGNAVLAFMVHHSLPGLLAPVEKQTDATKVVSISYVIAFCIYMVLGGTALAAFGCRVPQLYNLAFVQLPVPGIPTLLCGYPILLLAVYPIVGITLRNNLMNVLHLPPVGSTGKTTPRDVVATAITSLPPVAVAYATSNVQVIVKFFAGYFGLSLMLLMPSLLVLWARSNLNQQECKFPLQSRWASRPVVAVVVLLYAMAIAFNTYRLLL